MRTHGTDPARPALTRAPGRRSLVAVLTCLALTVPAATAFADPSAPAASATSTPATALVGATAAASSGSSASAASASASASSEAAITNAENSAAAKAAQVQAIQAQYAIATATLQAVQNTAEIAAEKYNGAEVLLTQRKVEADAASARAGAAAKAAAGAQQQVGDLAAHTYIDGGNLGDLEPFLAQGGPQEVLDRAAMLGTLSDIRTQGLQRAQAATAVAGVLQRQAAQAQAQALAAVQAAQTARAAAQAAADAATTQAATLKSRQDALIVELAALQQTSLALQEAHQAALQAANDAQVKLSAEGVLAAAAAASGKGVKYLVGTGSTAAPTARAALAIAFAQAQLGKWYLWGGAGPQRFDCSGLTMMAWRQAGVSLGHYTGWQYAHTAHFSIADRRPGDLIFYGPDVAGIHHVALYVGHDTMIEAPHTGAHVRYANIWRSDIIMTIGRP